MLQAEPLAEQTAEHIIETIHESILLLNTELQVLRANAAFYRTFNLCPADTIGHALYDMADRQWDIPRLRELIEMIRTRGAAVRDCEIEHDFPSIGKRIMLFNGYKLVQPAEQEQRILLTIADTTAAVIAQRQLQGSENMFRGFIQNINSIVIRFSAQGTITFINRFTEQTFGFSEQEVHGKPLVGTLLPEKDQQGNDLVALIKDMVRRPEKYYLWESEGIVKSGKRLLIQWSAKEVRDENGTVIEILMDGNDITALIKQRALLNETRMLVDLSPDIMVRFTRNLVCLYANRAMEHLLHRTRDTMVGKSLLHLELPRDLRAVFMNTRRKVLFDHRPHTCDIPYKKQFFHMLMAPSLDTGGTVRSLMIYARDVTDLHTISQALRRSEELFRTLTENSPDAVMRFNRTRQCIYLNPAAQQLIGIPEAALRHLPTHLNHLITPGEHAQQWNTILDKVIATGRQQTAEFAFSTTQGMRHYYSIFIPECHEGIIESVLMISRDVEDIHHYAVLLEERNQDLGSFNYSVSHDLRSPLTVIQGFSHLLLEDYADRLDSEGKRYLNIIIDSTRQMDDLIEGLLKLSRVGRAEIAMEQVDMRQLATTVIEEMRTMHPERNITFTLYDLPNATGDATLLSQVWRNLISNAVKFSAPVTHAVIEIGSYKEEHETVYYVRDNGVGFDMKHAKRLFNVFQRLHSAKVFPGTGVGLAIVQRVIQRHGGRVWAESEPYKRTTIYFTLTA
jgi:two-component system sensor kinase